MYSLFTAITARTHTRYCRVGCRRCCCRCCRCCCRCCRCCCRSCCHGSRPAREEGVARVAGCSSLVVRTAGAVLFIKSSTDKAPVAGSRPIAPLKVFEPTTGPRSACFPLPRGDRYAKSAHFCCNLSSSPSSILVGAAWYEPPPPRVVA